MTIPTPETMRAYAKTHYNICTPQIVRTHSPIAGVLLEISKEHYPYFSGETPMYGVSLWLADNTGKIWLSPLGKPFVGVNAQAEAEAFFMELRNFYRKVNAHIEVTA